VNLTGSMPIGIYQQLHHSKLHRGDIVSLCLPKAIALAGKRNDYIGTGPCPGNAMRLLKQVIAVLGDEVKLSSYFIRVNDHRYFAPQQRVNHKGRHIYHWIKNGIYRNTKNVWVYGSHDTVHSWDSRYFGGVSLNAINGSYRKLWTLSAAIRPRHLRTSFRFINPEVNPEVSTEENPRQTMWKNSYNCFKNKEIIDDPRHPPSPILGCAENFLTSPSQRPTSC